MLQESASKTASTRSVSSTAFEVIGERAFEDAIHVVVRWMRELNPAIPTDALRGSNFDIGGGGEHPARAVNLVYPQGRIWSATIDNPDKAVLGRIWVTEITVAEKLGEVHVGTRLLNISRKIDERFVPSIPRLVRNLLSRLSCSADGIALSDSAIFIRTDDDLNWLIGLLEHPNRRLPVIIMAEAVNKPPLLNLESFCARVCGAAHIIGLTASQNRQFNRRVGRNLTIYDGAVRLYRSSLKFDDADQYMHPLWLSNEGRSGFWSGVPIIARILSLGVSKGTTDYPRFHEVRRAAAEQDLDQRRIISPDSEMVMLYEEENKALREELQRLRSEQNQWLHDAEIERSASDSLTSEMRSELQYFREQTIQLRETIRTNGIQPIREALSDLSDFGGWAERNVSRKVWFAPKAVKEIEQNGQYARPEEVGEAVRILDEIYIPMRLGYTDNAFQGFQEKLQENNLQLSDCFANSRDLRRFPAYSLVYRSQRIWCDQHIKRGGGTDPRSMFRIYFHWYSEEGILLIGHLPSHLDNNLTN